MLKVELPGGEDGLAAVDSLELVYSEVLSIRKLGRV